MGSDVSEDILKQIQPFSKDFILYPVPQPELDASPKSTNRMPATKTRVSEDLSPLSADLPFLLNLVGDAWSGTPKSETQSCFACLFKPSEVCAGTQAVTPQFGDSVLYIESVKTSLTPLT